MQDPLLYRMIRPLVIAWLKLVYRPIMVNQSVIPTQGRALLAGTHVNDKDPLLLGMTTKRCVRYIAKDELFKGLGSLIFKGLGAIPVNRRIHDTQVIPTTVKLLEADCLVGIFPEGTINRAREDVILPFKAGVIKIALATDSPIIPFAIIAKYPKYPKNVKIIFDEPYLPQTKDIDKELKVLEKKVRFLIKNNERELS